MDATDEERVELSDEEQALIRARIGETQFKQKYLAICLGVAQSALNNYLGGRTMPRKTLAALVGILSIAELQARYPELITPEEEYVRQRAVLTVLYEEWLQRLTGRARNAHYRELAWLVEHTIPVKFKAFPQMLRIYARGKPLDFLLAEEAAGEAEPA